LDYLYQYFLFLAQLLTLVGGVLLVVGGIAAAGSKIKKLEKKGHIEIETLNEHYEQMRDIIEDKFLSEEEQKKKHKEQKAESKRQKSESIERKVFVIDFHGDIKATEAHALEQLVSAILVVATSSDEVVLRLESGGGMVHSYGYASSQLQRLREKKIPLTVCVDKVAASGGYMMACLASQLLAAPFAVIGSIGVLAQVPNFHRLLKKHDIDFEMVTAGEYKRTLTLFGENTEKGRDKFTEEIQETHQLFKDFVADAREGLDVDKVATGEVWFGNKAIDLGLIDRVSTSEAYILEQVSNSRVFHLDYVEKQSLMERMGLAARHTIGGVLDDLFQRDRSQRYFTE
jgi:serine protease SohB